ncbi:MAG: hypothetical protein ACREQY_05385 [Candidatus Binatia bacterium]
MGTTPDRQYGRELATELEVDAKVVAHRDRTLLHDVDRAGKLEVARDAGGRVQFVRMRDGAGGPLLRETEVARDVAGRASTITDRQFDPPGTLVRSRVLALARGADNRVTDGTVTVS